MEPTVLRWADNCPENFLNHYLFIVIDLATLLESLLEYSRNLEQMVSARTYEIEQRRRVAESLHGLLTLLNSNRPLVILTVLFTGGS